MTDADMSSVTQSMKTGRLRQDADAIGAPQLFGEPPGTPLIENAAGAIVLRGLRL